MYSIPVGVSLSFYTDLFDIAAQRIDNVTEGKSGVHPVITGKCLVTEKRFFIN